MALRDIRAEDEVFLGEGTVGVGAVREVRAGTLLVWFERAGEHEIGPEHVASAHDGKVILDRAALPADLAERLDHAHDAERRDGGAGLPD